MAKLFSIAKKAAEISAPPLRALSLSAGFSRKPNAKEARELEKAYSIMASVFLRKNTRENLQPVTRKKIVKKLLSESRFKNRGDWGMLAQVFAKKGKTKAVYYTKPHRENSDLPLFGTAGHEAVHLLGFGSANPLGFKPPAGHNILATASRMLLEKKPALNYELHLPKASIGSGIARRHNVENDRARSIGHQIGSHAAHLAQSTGSRKAGWDYLFLLSKGASYAKAEDFVRKKYAKK